MDRQTDRQDDRQTDKLDNIRTDTYCRHTDIGRHIDRNKQMDRMTDVAWLKDR